MTIAEVSRKYDISADTLRYYERIGLIPPVPRTRGGLRDYGDESCGWIQLMKCMRAAGVQIATRLIATEECDASQAYKDAILRARAEDVRIIHRPVGMPGRAIYSPLIARMEAGQRQAPAWCAGCIKTCDPAQTHYCITHALIRAVEGDWEEGLFFCGAEVGQVNEMSTVAEVLAEYQAALNQR